MKTRAAILWEPHTDWSVEDIELDPPKKGEILVKLAASGLCHSDEHMVTGDMVLDPELAEAFGLKQFPVIGGHEGAGVVEEVGPDTAGFEVGDHVVFSFIPSCGKCPSCSTGHQHLCDLGAFLLCGHAAQRLLLPPPRQGRPRPRHHGRARHVLAVHGRQRRLRGEDPPGRPARARPRSSAAA